MSNPLSRVTTQSGLWREPVATHRWLRGAQRAVRRLSEGAERRVNKARPGAYPNLPVPDRKRLYADMAILLEQDLANIEAGIYPLPADHDGSLLTLLRRSRIFFEDLPAIHRRRESSTHNEVRAKGTRGKRPRYYLQNFHFQTGGWMMDDLASRYDTQVEVLFNGTANATRRQALPQLHEIFAGRDQRKLRLPISAAGQGAFLIFSSRPGRGFRSSGSICLGHMSNMPSVI